MGQTSARRPRPNMIILNSSEAREYYALAQALLHYCTFSAARTLPIPYHHPPPCRAIVRRSLAGPDSVAPALIQRWNNAGLYFLENIHWKSMRGLLKLPVLQLENTGLDLFISLPLIMQCISSRLKKMSLKCICK